MEVTSGNGQARAHSPSDFNNQGDSGLRRQPATVQTPRWPALVPPIFGKPGRPLRPSLRAKRFVGAVTKACLPFSGQTRLGGKVVSTQRVLNQEGSKGQRRFGGTQGNCTVPDEEQAKGRRFNLPSQHQSYL